MRQSQLTILWLLTAATWSMGAELSVSKLSVGRNLQAPATVRLSEPAPEGGLEITIKSSDPARLLVSRRQDQPGSATIKITVKARFRESLEFWVVGAGEPGQAAYTASAADWQDGTGEVSVTPSAVVLSGPYAAPSFRTTPRAPQSRLILRTYRLDESLKPVEEQMVAAGLTLEAEIRSSEPSVGEAHPNRVRFTPEHPSVVAFFKPGSSGQTVLSVGPIPGFTRLEQNITANVQLPGILVTTETVIGANLQIASPVGLGEAAPEGGVEVTLTTSDPSKLLLSRSATEVGSETIKVKISEGQAHSTVYLQALASSGNATYLASAPGFQDRTAKIRFAPSGVVITPHELGPPDEGELFEPEPDKGMITKLSAAQPRRLAVWVAQLDPVTMRSADITVQPLRAGMRLKVDLKNSNPKVGELPESVVIEGGAECAHTFFKPQAVGTTVLSVSTPEGFGTSSNSTSIKAIVKN